MINLIKKLICKIKNHELTYQDKECNTRYFTALTPLDITRRYFCSRCGETFLDIYFEKETKAFIRQDLLL